MSQVRRFKGGVGPWKIFHTGKMEYSIAHSTAPEKTLATARNISDAYRQAERFNLKHENGAPMFAPSGMMLDDQGNRSIFDDIDQ